MRSKPRILLLGACVALLVASLASGAAAVDGDGEDPSIPVPDLYGQFAYLQLHGDPMAFHLGVGDDPMTCRHYQGLARVDGEDGTAYMILTRSGNTTWLGDCSADSKNYAGELLVVEMGSRTDRAGERLRSNLLSHAASMGDTIPPTLDRGVAHFHLDGSFGETAPGASDGPKFSHPGGVQVIDDVLVVPLEKECTSGYSGDCETDLTERGGLALIDVRDPTNPELLHWQYMTDSLGTEMDAVGVVGVAYVGPDQHPVHGDRYLFVLAWGDSTDLRFAWSNTGNLRTTTEFVLETFSWNEDMLGHNKARWRNWQMLNFVRDPEYPGVLGLIGAEKMDIIIGEIAIPIEDRLGLFAVDPAKLTEADIEGAVVYLQEKHLTLEPPDMGSLDAASGVYVSPTGQLILYTASHDNDAAGGTVGMGEFRNVTVYHGAFLPGAPAVDKMCPWVELYEDSYGWWDDSPDRSLMLDFEDRNLDNGWMNLEYEGFGDEADAVVWFREPGQRIRLYWDDTWSGDYIEFIGPAGQAVAVGNLDEKSPYIEYFGSTASWGDDISSVKMSPFADPGGPYTGTVDVPVPLSGANRCLTADSVAYVPVQFSWTVDSEACTFSDPTARQPQLTCDQAGTFDATLSVSSPAEWPGIFTAATEVTIVESPNQPPVAEGFSVTVAEDIAVGTTLGTVTGTDPDADPLTFTITAGNTAGLFGIAASTGVVTTVGELDYETATQHVLTVAVSDGDLTDETTVTVTVTDVDETPPPPPPPPPPGPPLEYEPFSDDDGSIFEADIEWLAWEGITKGCNPPDFEDMFCPDDYVTRGQMAAFLVRALGYVDDGGGDLFVDDDGSIFHMDIDKLKAAGVTKGCNPPDNTMYCPNDQVTRGQMAAFLVRALGYTDDGGGDLFVDDNDSMFETDIDTLKTAGVTLGCNPPANTKYCPGGSVTRAQMAAFLHRALGTD